ncbi:MAG: hypothetical protein Q7R39_12940, partial [Dehalococcoidia bacterium]|nr:hypothetical protein [Dehalococcoidia bacterium]
KRSISSPGGTVSYSIVVSNTGTMNIAARVTDTLPLSLTYVANSLQSTMGTSLYDSGTGSVLWAGPALVNVPVTIGYQAKVPASAASGATIANTASVQAVGSTPRETLPVTVTVASNPSRIGWQNLGLYGARMEDVAIDPTTGIVLLASGGTTGVYRSVDGGNSWLPSTAFGGCLRLLLDESSGTAYVSCRPEPNQSGLWKSTDAGLTWVSVLSKALYPAFSDGEVTAVAMAGTTLYVADWTGGVWASTDAGQTWTRRAVTQSTPVNALAADATAPAVVYATTSSRAFKSTNAGATWAEVTPSGGSVTGLRSIAVNPHNPSAVFIGTGADGGYRLYKSVDSGLNWTTISLLSGSVSWIEFHPSDANTLFTQHMRSTDNGDTWQGFNVGGGGLAIDPTNPNIIYGGSTQGAHKSIDGGATWTEIDTGLEEVAVTGVAQNPRDVNFFLIGSKMGFGRTLDSGANWTWPLDLSTLPQPDMFGNAVAVEPSAAYLSGGDSILGRSTDNGATWSAGNLQQVVQNDLGTSGRPGVGDIGLVPGETGHLFAAVRESPEGNPTPKGAVYESTDRGLTWTSTGLTGVPVNAIGFVPTASGTVIYAGVGDSWGRYAGAGSVYTSTVGSTSVWRQTTMSTTAPVIIKLRVDPTSPLVIYAGGGFVQTGTSAATMKGVLYKTNDGGATWREITPKLPDSGPTEIRAIAIDPGFTSNVFCSQGNVVYQSVDGGATWSTLSESNLGMEGIDALIVPLVAPSPVVTFTATVSGSQAVLNWTNPSDTDLAGVVVKYSTQGFPMLSTEGITLTAKLAGDPGVYTHTNTISGTTYYYSAFTYNQAGRYSLPYQAAANSSAAGLLTSASELSLRSTASLPRRPAAQASNKSLYAAAGGGLFAKEIAGQTSVFLPALTRGFAGAW